MKTTIESLGKVGSRGLPPRARTAHRGQHGAALGLTAQVLRARPALRPLRSRIVPQRVDETETLAGTSLAVSKANRAALWRIKP
jgi:hypothetical protein